MLATLPEPPHTRVLSFQAQRCSGSSALRAPAGGSMTLGSSSAAKTPPLRIANMAKFTGPASKTAVGALDMKTTMSILADYANAITQLELTPHDQEAHDVAEAMCGLFDELVLNQNSLQPDCRAMLDLFLWARGIGSSN